MIRISITKNDNFIEVIKVVGHSGYANEGSDIVCSSVTTAMYVSYGILKKANCDFSLKEDSNIPLMELRINKIDNVSKIVMDNLLDVLEGIAFDYKAYVQIIN